MTSDFASPTLARFEKSLSRSMKPRRLVAPPRSRSQDRALAFRAGTSSPSVRGVIGQSGIRHPTNFRVLRKVFGDRLRVLRMPFDAERQRLEALEKEPRVERRLRGAKIAQELDARLDDVRERTERALIPNAVVRGIGLDEITELPDAAQSNLPPSTIRPPIDVPWPPMNLVAECTTTSAPHSIGRSKYGVASVLSTISGIPF